MRIDEIIELSTVFSAEVNVERDFKYENTDRDSKIDGYLPNRSSRNIIKSIFKTLSTRADRKLHLITASYGTGKSYLLLILAYLLGNKNVGFFQELERKLADKDSLYDDGLTETLHQYWAANTQYLIVIPQYGTEDFEQGMLAALNRSLAQNKISYVPRTNYIRAAEMLQSWQTNNQVAYNQFQDLLPNKNGIDFIRLLKECDGPSYIKFKELYKKLFTDFSENHGDIYTAFQETANHISSLGFKGIVTIYDEFGGVLEKLINKSELSSTTKIQNFLEYVKDKKEGNANLIFIAASHQDPNTLNENKQQSIDKLLGRFELYRLEVADSESEELIAQIFRKRNETEKEAVLNSGNIDLIMEEVHSMDLYADRSDDWIISKIIKSLYPLHPLTAYILPRLSNQFAQNSRTMFNFLSPDETSTGSLRKFVESTDAIDAANGKIALFTPDLLLGYFRPNLSASSAVSAYVDAFDDAMGKENDPLIRRLLENMLILTVSRRKEVRPTFEVLLNAMRFENRDEFKNLLDDLVGSDKLELNPRDKVYEFPIIGTRNFGKVFDDEKKKLSDLNIYDCKTIWEEVQPLEDYKFILHQEKYGANRTYASVAISFSKDLDVFLENLRKIYKGEIKESPYQGYVVYLLLRDEGMIEAFKNSIETAGNEITKYIIFAKPKESDTFGKLITNSIEFQAYVNTSTNVEIKSNPNHAEKARTSISKARYDLSNTVKQIFSPKKWEWSFDGLTSWRDIDNVRVLDTNMDGYIEQMFAATISVKDDALWFGKSSPVNTKARLQAITNILTPEKKGIYVFNGNNNSHENRILTNFFISRSIVKDTKTGPNIQYGEIIIPHKDTSWNKVWMVIDEALAVNSIVTPDRFIVPLLQSPYGLSETMIKFVFACYVRFNADILIFTDPRNTFTIHPQSASVIDEMFKKPAVYGVRKIEMSDFAKRYVKALHGLFTTEGAVNSFENVSRRFENSNFFTALQLALIRKDPEVKKYYEAYLMPFVESLKADKTNRENEAKEFFMETLPPFIIPGITKELFENDNQNAKIVVEKLRFYKSYPLTEESSFRLEVLRNIASQVFGKSIATPEEFKRVVTNWFSQLSPNTKTVARFENEKIRMWLKLLRIDDSSDILKFYLEELPIKPIKDWTDLFDDRSIFINTIREYKEEIDNYKKSPIAVYQFIARECFQIPKADCPTEQTFITLFLGWWDNLPQLNKEAIYEQDFINIFIKEFNSSASMVQRLLINIPIKWKDAGVLNIITNDWENWSPDEEITVSSKYGELAAAMNTWEAPIPETEFVAALGEIFGLSGIIDFETLKSRLLSKWFNNLPFNTQTAVWNQNSTEEQFVQTLRSNKMRAFFMTVLPEKFNYQVFRYWTKPVLKQFINKIKELRTSIEGYRRPMMELVVELDKKLKTKSNTVAEFRANLKELIRATDAFNNMAEEEEGYLSMPAAVVLITGTRNLITDAAFDKLIEKLARECGIEEDYYLWQPETQTTFVKNVTDVVKYVRSWKFPEEQLLTKAKEKIGTELKIWQNDLQLSDAQLFKVLRDLINEHKGVYHENNN